MNEQVTLEMIADAAKALNGVAQKTPIVSACKISPNVFFKAENLQKTGSFKIRGAYNKIRNLTDEEAARGVIACSAGNHAQGVAVSATRRGIKSTICMPEDAPLMKVEATKNYGANVVLVPGSYDDAAKEAARLSQEEGYTFIHPFDDPYVIAGQGSLGLEILQQVPDVEQIIVPIGGGGLISGVALAVKALKPKCKIIGVQAKRVASMNSSIEADHIVTIPNAKTVADGLHVLTPGQITFEMVKKYVDQIVTVDEDEICAAELNLLEGPKLVAEGAGATTLAAFLYAGIDQSRKTVCIVSGGNVDTTTMEKIFTRGLNKTGRLFKITVCINDTAAKLSDLIATIASVGVGSIDFRRDQLIDTPDVNTCDINLAIETTGFDQIEKVKQALRDKNYEFTE